MKVLVVYDNPDEVIDAQNLVRVLNSGLGRMLTKATIHPDGMKVSMPNGLPVGVTINAELLPAEWLRTRRVVPQPNPPAGIRQIDFDEGDDQCPNQ